MSSFTSELHNEKTFYDAFTNDLLGSKKEVIIESPYITTERMNSFRSVFNNLIENGVKIYILTRDPKEHTQHIRQQAQNEISNFENIGIQALLALGNYHRKLAIIDRKILWEGSLNILPQNNSHEIMRRIESKVLTEEMFSFLRLDRFI